MAALVARVFFVLSMFGAMAFQASAEVRLVMIEEDGCFWCARWEREIGPIYPKTSEGRIAPLRKVEIYGPEIKEFDFKSTPTFTPTFILVKDNVEVGRLEGYPGDEFFWTMIQRLIQMLPEEVQADPAS